MFKKIIIALAVFLSLPAATALATDVELDNYIIEVTASALYVRSGPGTSPALGWIATVHSGEQLELLAYNPDREYCYVETMNQGRGWVATRYTSATGEEMVLESDLLIPVIVEENEKCRIAVSDELREEPNKNSAVTLKVSAGNKVTVEKVEIDSDGTPWCYVLWGGWRNGWIKQSALDKKGIYGEHEQNSNTTSSESNFAPADSDFEPNYSPKKVGETYHVISGVNVRCWLEGCENSLYLNDRTTKIIGTLPKGTEVKVIGVYGNIITITASNGVTGLVDGSFIG